jgi:hypothetical protein
MMHLLECHRVGERKVFVDVTSKIGPEIVRAKKRHHT